MGERIRDYEIFDERFRYYLLGNCDLELVHDGMKWCEGPVYFSDGDYFVWSDIPNNRMMRWVDGLGVSVFRSPSNNSNGNTRDRQGRLISCEHLSRRVTRMEIDGSITVLVDNYEGKRLNSPNDVVVKSDGTIWFTDPPYGIMSDYEGKRSPSETGKNYVFRYDPKEEKLTVVADDFQMPNGLAFSPDEKYLYISDTGATHDKNGAHHIRRFQVKDGNELSGNTVFVEVNPGISDGFRVDIDGNVWSSAADGVHCYSPGGELLGKILVPDVVANLTFGGKKRNQLFIMGTHAVYSVYVGVAGAQYP